jgi:hypothetical protein
MREATISFRIMHEELDPEEISRVLQIKPKGVHREHKANLKEEAILCLLDICSYRH